jgi:CheY-like chemotaxis protein
VIVLDMMTPRMDGQPFLHERAREAPLAASGSRPCLPSGGEGIAATAFLPKPFDVDRLLTTLRDYC